MGKHQMKKILKIATLAACLTAAGNAIAQTAPEPAPATAAPAQTAPAGEDWNPFSRSTAKVYMADVNGFVTTGDVISVRVAKVSLTGAPGDYSYAVDQIEMRCAAKQSRLVFSIEYGPDGVQTDRFDDPEEWAPYAPETRDAYLSQLVCDGDRASPPTWPSVKAFIDAGRH
jgi:hypothetical protein